MDQLREGCVVDVLVDAAAPTVYTPRRHGHSRAEWTQSVDDAVSDYFTFDQRAWPRVRIHIAAVAVPDSALLRSVAVLGEVAKR
ncbi:MAG: hypothetical protein IPH72_24115 [Sandaracinaceae bacterium]|nr:hypothetical protein [Sandaracinaceae bacterium]